jgi:type II secretory pathway component PulF
MSLAGAWLWILLALALFMMHLRAKQARPALLRRLWRALRLTDGRWHDENWLPDAARALRSLARGLRITALELECGVPLPEACRMVSRTGLAGKRGALFERWAEAGEAGKPLGDALAEAGFPEPVRALLAAGGAARELPTALRTAAEFCDQGARRSERAWGAIHACLLVGILGIVAGIVEFLVFRSIYDIQNVVLHMLPSGKWP